MKITRFEEFCERSVPYFIGLVILVILLVMGSCNRPNRPNLPKTVSESGGVYETVVIEGCEYLFWIRNNLGQRVPVGHKGNCKNHKPCEKE